MSEDNNKTQPRIQLSGLWKQETKSGKVFYSGNLGSVQLQLWPNKYKTENDSRPSLILYVVKRERKEKREEKARFPDSEDPGKDEDIPF